jgi:hypothetical protein
VIPRRQCSGAQAYRRSRVIHTDSQAPSVQACGWVGERRVASEAAE